MCLKERNPNYESGKKRVIKGGRLRKKKKGEGQEGEGVETEQKKKRERDWDETKCRPT